MKFPKIMLNLTKYTKTNFKLSDYMEDIHNFLQTHSNNKHIYTEDSKILDRGGYSAILNNMTIQKRLPDNPQS